MKIIAFGDIHMTLGNFAQIPGIKTADLIILTGDLTNLGGRTETKEILNQVMTINPRVVAQFGNLDRLEVNSYLDELDINLHGQARLLQRQVCLMGLGGSNPTPFKTPTEFTEEELSTYLKQAHAQAKTFMDLSGSGSRPKIPLILVSHTPPLDTKADRLSGDVHVGSSAVRRFIEEQQPALCLCGHIHEAKAEDWIGKTHILNPGMIHKHGWIEIDINTSASTGTRNALKAVLR